MSDLARERGCSPLDVMCELALREDLDTRFRAYIANDDVDAVRDLLTHEHVIFGFARRGYLRAGFWADVCVFDPDTVGPGPLRRVRDFPANAERLTAEEPLGVRHVLVNGTPIRVDGAQVDPLEQRPGTQPEIV